MRLALVSVNISKTKFMAAGAGIVGADQAPLDGVVDHVEAFRYLGCHVTPDARSSFDVSRREAAASGAFCTLRESVFDSDDFSIAIKRIVYGVTVLAVLLYGSESWTVRQRDVRRLKSFHLQCVRSILKINCGQQIQEHISSLQVRRMWGDIEEIADKVRVRRLRWLGHASRLQDRIPRQLLYGA